MLGVDRDHHAGELRPLALVDRKDVGQGQLVEVAEVVLHLPTLETDHHVLLDPVDLLDHPQIAVEHIPIIVIFRLDYPVSP